MVFLRAFNLSHGSSCRNLMQTSNVAPPHVSNDQKPMSSIFSAMPSMASVRIRVAMSDWCASRNVVSVIFTGFAKARALTGRYEWAFLGYFKFGF